MATSEALSLFVAAGGVLAAAIAYLFVSLMQLHKEHTKINSSLGRLEGERDGIRSLSQETLEVVHRAVLQRTNRRLDEEETTRRN